MSNKSLTARIQTFLKVKPNIEDINFAVDAFQACVARVGADIDAPKYIINEQVLFYKLFKVHASRAFLNL